jgi:voltage-gated potassium channel
MVTWPTVAERHLDSQRWRLLHNVVRLLEPIMAVLGIVWMLLLIIDVTRGTTTVLSYISGGIWLVFVVDFVAELLIAPRKLLYLKKHWLAAIALAVPPVRVARLAMIFRAGRAIRGLRLVRTIASLNRGMLALRSTMRRRGTAYVAVFTLLVTLVGAAAMYSFENGVKDPNGIHDYGTALWWTAMIMTTMGSTYWPQTDAGRIMCVLLAIYSFTVFGYLTATLATFFIDRDASRDDAAVAGQQSIDKLAEQIAALRALVAERTGETRRAEHE